MVGSHKIMLSERGQTQKIASCMQSPQTAKVICAIRSQNSISLGLDGDSEGSERGFVMVHLLVQVLLAWCVHFCMYAILQQEVYKYLDLIHY